jgi:predicted O-methyltransferase YrrM
MTRARLRSAAYVLAAVCGLLVLVGAVTDSTDLAVGVAGVAIVALTVAVHESFRVLGRQVKAVGASGGDRGRPGSNKQLGTIDRQLRGISGQVGGVARAIDLAPSQVVELHRRYDQLVPGTHAMPSFGSWAAAVPTVLAILEEVMHNDRRRLVLECGSGSSTVWVAAAMARRGAGHVVALEHDADFAAVTRRQLNDHGLSSWATVVEAPLVQTTLPDGSSQPWYDLARLGELNDVDILFVDGPPGNTSPQARFPAFPLLQPLLREGAWVVLDDTHRREERAIREAWITSTEAESRLQIDRVVGRSTFMVWGDPDGEDV